MKETKKKGVFCQSKKYIGFSMINRKTIFYVVLIFFMCISIEIVLRFLGYQPYEKLKYTIGIEPKMCYKYDSLGIKLSPGEYEININNGLIFKATHNEKGRRITSFYPEESKDKKIHLYGCSYTYGTGVNDNETYPFLLQENFPNYEISNFAVPGYGTLHFYIQLIDNITNSNIPDIVILNCAEFHEERNVFSKSYMYKIYQGLEVFEIEETSNQRFYPKILINNKSNNFNIEYCDILQEYRPMPFRKHSAFINLIEKISLKEPHSLTSSFLIIDSIKKICDEYGIKLIVTSIDNKTENFLQYCNLRNIKFANISPDFSDNSYTNLPYDLHPSKKAHLVYFKNIEICLKEFLKNN